MPVIWNTVMARQFYHQFENKYTIFHMEGVSIMLLKLKYSIGIDGYGHEAGPGWLWYLYHLY